MRNPANPGMGGGMSPSPGMMNKMMPGMMNGGMMGGMMKQPGQAPFGGQMGGMVKPPPMMGASMGQNYGSPIQSAPPMMENQEAPEEVPGVMEQMQGGGQNRSVTCSTGKCNGTVNESVWTRTAESDAN